MAWEILDIPASNYNGYYYAINSESEEAIRSGKLETLQLIVAYLNSQPHAYLAGEPVELDALTPVTPDNSVELYETIVEANTHLTEYPHHTLRGLFILPIPGRG